MLARARTRILRMVLGRLLKLIQEHDTDYDRRYGYVLRAVAAAEMLGLQAGYRIDKREPEWPVAFIELPTGQVSWHIPQHPRSWDYHSTKRKYIRCERYRRFWARTEGDEV